MSAVGLFSALIVAELFSDSNQAIVMLFAM